MDTLTSVFQVTVYTNINGQLTSFETRLYVDYYAAIRFAQMYAPNYSNGAVFGQDWYYSDQINTREGKMSYHAHLTSVKVW